MSSSVVDLTQDDPAPAGNKRGITNDDLRTLARERERRQRLQPPTPQPARPASTSTRAAIGDEVWASRANVEEVRVMRLGESPVIAFQNFGGDRGVRMAQITRLEETVHKATEGTRSRYRSRVELDADSGVGPSIDMKIAAERLMSLALNHPEVRNDPAAIASLRRQTEWGGSATLLYPAGATLGRHKDGCGNWVAIFSFGRSVEFFAGDTSELLESGDAILFNGGTRHGALHGIDFVLPHATVNSGGGNEVRALPHELDYLEPYRCSVQVRQRDPPAEWGWPPPARASGDGGHGADDGAH